MDDKPKMLIENYTKILSGIDVEKGVKIMAISKDEKQLLKEIYDNNQELIMKMFEAVSGELDMKEKEALHVLKEHIKNRSIRWSYSGKTMTSKELVHCIIKEQLQKGQSIEMLSKFKMHSAPMIVTSIQPDEDRYDILELNDGKVIYVRNCCDMKDILKLIEELNIEVMKIEG